MVQTIIKHFDRQQLVVNGKFQWWWPRNILANDGKQGQVGHERAPCESSNKCVTDRPTDGHSLLFMRVVERKKKKVKKKKKEDNIRIQEQ